MADMKSFIKKRASIKAKLTQFNSYLNISKSCEKLSEVQVIEIEYRLNIFESLYEKYDALQDELEALMDDPSEQYAEREEFEKLYYGLVASARQLISGSRKLLEGDSANEVDSCITSTHKHNSIRLPKIDLPKFSGSYHDWLEFRDTFVSIVHNNTSLDKINKLHYLRVSLKGSASLVVDNLDFRSENYDAAWKLLCERYDNKRLLVNNHVQALFNVQPIDRESSKSLRHIIDTTNKNLRALSTLGQPVQNAFVDVLVIYIMTSKLDHVTNRQWEEHRNTFSEPPTLSAFTHFISNRADLLETLEESKPIATAKSEPAAPAPKPKSSSVQIDRPSKPLSCPMCHQNHFIFACEQFKGLSVQARIKKAQGSNVCMNCLRPGHDISKCRLGHCKYCRKKHNTLLHIDSDNVLPSAHNTALSANQLLTSQVILLSTALVKVTDADGNHHTARVLLDSGSTTNFISEDFVRKLNAPTYIVKSKVTGINVHTSTCTQGCLVSLKSIDDSEYELNINCLVLPKVSASVPNTYVDISNIRIPTNVRLADPTYYVPSSIDVLVGAEVFWDILGTGRIALGNRMPTLLESKLGWLISGACHQSDSSSHVCMYTNNLQVDLDRFWELDSVSSIHKHSGEERSCEQHFMDTTYRNSDGRFVVSIPFKESLDVLGDSYMMAKQRFLSLERRLGRDPHLKSLYVDFLNEYIELGHMSESTRRPLDSTYSNYLPHHGVLKESRTTTKLRVVFDASARTASGKSFNDIQIVPTQIQDAWNEFQNSLHLLNEFKIPRWVLCESASCLQLHIFTDASEKAYGACVYVRSVSRDGEVNVHLLTAKSKVAPIKSTTIPRLELCGALLGSRLYSKVRQSLTLKFDEVHCWCDSTIVLGWLSTSPNQLKSFVRHRVSEIQETVGGEAWHYVPSAENPADLASRGLRTDRLLSSSLWWSGPQFLTKDVSSWPQFPESHHNNSGLPETVSSCHVSNHIIENPITALFSKFSSFSTLQRVTAYVMRFINKCNKKSFEAGSLTSVELSNSLNLLLKLSQIESFPEEYHLLKSGKQLPAKNKLLSLSPFFDTLSNLIRVGGRLDNSFYDYNVKHPILLSSSHTICILLFNMFHVRLLHAGPQLLLATVRHHYYPIGGRNLAKKVTHQCVKCCRIKANTIQPIMGNLPEQRLHLEFPFLDTGVDYAGPIMIADRKGRGCRLIKCFISVFVCLATRAIHLELVSDLTKEAFLAALNRFIARRGKPRNIFSDNGTTFVGAFNELARLLSQDLNFNNIDPGINFSFIPAYTPHFGGLWESAVKSTKHHLRRILGLTNLNFEEMATCLIQVEAILNSRPLTPLSNDPTDLAPLTPAHFLIGRSLIMLPHPQIQNAKVNSLQRFRRIEYLKQHFWARFSHEYVLWLQERTKWCRSSGELKEGTLVVIKDKTLPPLMWLLGRITHILPGRDGVARVADILTRKGVIRRAFNTICPLPVSTVEDPSTGGAC